MNFIKTIKWLTISFILIISLIIITIYATDSSYLLKGIRVVYLNGYNTAFLDDYKFFDNRTIKTNNPKPWSKSTTYNSVKSTDKLSALNLKHNSTAYLIFKNDSLWYEEYFQGNTANTLSNSFSVSKSIVAAIVGKAIDLGYLKSVNEKVIKYIPTLTGEFAEKLTIKDLMTMKSGIPFQEVYNSPVSITTKLYFYDNLTKLLKNYSVDEMPGEKFQYQSANTQILAMVLNKVLPMSLSDFVSHYFWEPMGAEHDALWQYNKGDGIEKAYCCIATNARDLARFGKLYLNHGEWDGKKLLSKDYIEESLSRTSNESSQLGYSWWLGEYNDKDIYSMKGHLGQFVIVVPEDELIVVRLGNGGDNLNPQDSSSTFYQYIDQAYEMLDLKD